LHQVELEVFPFHKKSLQTSCNLQHSIRFPHLPIDL
jgi:hypothetical protein